MTSRAVRSLALVLLLVTASAAQTLPTADRVLTQLRLVNDQFLRTWPNPGADIVTDKARPSNIWTRATYFEGLMALYKISPNPAYYDYAVRWGESHAWNLAYGSVTDRVADDQCCGQTYLDLYAIDPRPERLAKIKTAIDNMVNSTKADDWWWIDALQMAMPLFARLGVQTNDPRYFDKMYALYSHTRSVEGGRGLYNPTEHLWWRDADFDPPYKEPNGANCYWARGNGWVFAALARVLDILPADAPHRAEYLATFQDMAAALVPLQRSDGYWNVSLLDPDNYGGRELTGTAFFTYGLAWGIRQGHLPRATYLPVVATAWRALSDFAVRPDGTLGYVQGTGKQPSDSQPVTYASQPNFDDFGTGAFLLAGAEVYQLAATPLVEGADLGRFVDHIQTSATTVALADGSPYRVEARVRATGFETRQLPSYLTFPRSPTTTMLTLESNDSGHFVCSLRAASAAALDTAYPDGTYTFVLAGTVRASVTSAGAAKWATSAFPAAPTATVTAGTWNAGRLLLDAAQGLTITASRPASGEPGGPATVTLTLEGPGFRASRTASASSVSGPVSLTLPPFALTPGGTYAVRLDASNVQAGADVVASANTCTFHRTTSFQIVATEPAFSRAKLLNVSSRGIASSDTPLIAGFVVSPGGPKMVLVRAAGPSLQPFGVTGALANPSLRLSNAAGTRAWQNDDWQSSSLYFAHDAAGAIALQAAYTNVRDATLAATEAGAFPLTPRSRDAALVVVLPPGNYTAQIYPSGTTAAGTALVEVYELATTQTNPRLTNLATRGPVSATEPLTAGFVVTGGTRRVLVRAVGPTLASLGLPASAVLRDPVLAVFNAAGTQIAQNDNWNAAPNPVNQAAVRASLGAFALPAGSKDAETLLELAPGAYTLRVTSADGGTGTALVEVYTEPPGAISVGEFGS